MSMGMCGFFISLVSLEMGGEVKRIVFWLLITENEVNE